MAAKLFNRAAKEVRTEVFTRKFELEKKLETLAKKVKAIKDSDSKKDAIKFLAAYQKNKKQIDRVADSTTKLKQKYNDALKEIWKHHPKLQEAIKNDDDKKALKEMRIAFKQFGKLGKIAKEKKALDEKIDQLIKESRKFENNTTVQF